MNGFKRLPVSNKEERARKAQEWVNTLNSSKYETLMNTAIESTVYVSDPSVNDVSLGSYETNVKVYNKDVVTCTHASITHDRERVCVLDFASYTNPGGGFLKGSMAQEEALCHASGLYLCLESKHDVYDKRKKWVKDGLYRDDYIYVKACPFITSGKVDLADVMVIAAPNTKRTKATQDEISKVLHRRMEIAFLEPYKHGCKNIVLGAFGCGVFGNDVKEVASIWSELQTTYNGLYKNIVYAVTDKKMYKIFKEKLERK